MAEHGIFMQLMVWFSYGKLHCGLYF